MRIASLCCMHDCKLKSKLRTRKIKPYIDTNDTEKKVLKPNSSSMVI